MITIFFSAITETCQWSKGLQNLYSLIFFFFNLKQTKNMLIKGMNLCTLRLIRTFLDFQVMVTLLLIPLYANSCQNQHDASKFRYVLCKCTHNLHSVMQSQHRHIPTNLTACNNYTSAHKLDASTLKLNASVLCVTKVSNVDFHNGQLLVNSYSLINPGSNLLNLLLLCLPNYSGASFLKLNRSVKQFIFPPWPFTDDLSKW